VCVYLSMPSGEIDTHTLVREAFRQGKRVFVPRVVGKNPPDMRMVEVSSVDEISSFPMSPWGIPELSLDETLRREDGTYCGDIDLVICPGVAFDQSGRRLGHGKGYYDCFLARLFASLKDRGRPRTTTIGIGLREQLLPLATIPMDSLDMFLDWVVTPDGVYEGAEGRRGEDAAWGG